MWLKKLCERLVDVMGSRVDDARSFLDDNDDERGNGAVFNTVVVAPN